MLKLAGFPSVYRFLFCGADYDVAKFLQLLVNLLYYISSAFFLSVGCDDLVGAVFEMAKTLSRLQLSEEEMALFTATVLLSPGSFTVILV